MWDLKIQVLHEDSNHLKSMGWVILLWEMCQVVSSWEKHRLFSKTCSVTSWIFLLMRPFHFDSFVTQLLFGSSPYTLPSHQWHSDTHFVFNLTIHELQQSKKCGFGRNFEWPLQSVLQYLLTELCMISCLTKGPPFCTHLLPSSSEAVLQKHLTRALAD